ncbi:hypothetical protein [Thalassotalea fusca]
MKKIISLSDAVPSEIALLKAINLEPEYLDKSVSELLAIVDKHFDVHKDNVINRVLDKLGVTEEDLADAKAFWSSLHEPISAYQDKTWDIDWNTAKTIGADDLISFNVTATAATSLFVDNATEALEKHHISIDASDIIVNHEVKLGGGAGASGTTNFGFVNVSAGGQYSGEIQVDAFSQYPQNEKVLDVFADYFFAPVKIWDVQDIEEKLQSGDAASVKGLRKLTIETEGTFQLNGGLKLGKAWALTGEGNNKDLSADISANLGISKAYQHTGKVYLSFEKVQSQQTGQPVICATVELGKSTLDKSAVNLDIDAEIKGLDKVAERYVNQLFNESDELVEFMQEWSKPASKIIGTGTSRLSDDKWYTPLAKLVLGTESVDAVTKELIDDELTEILDKHALSTNINSEKLARSTVEKLLDVFSIDSDSSLAVKARTALTERINDWKAELDTKIRDKLDGLSIDARSNLLKPLALLGENVTDLANQADDKVYQAVKNGIDQYQAFKEKLTKELTLSANIKLGLGVEVSKSRQTSEAQKITIEFNHSDNPTVRTLFKKLVIGDTRNAAKLAHTLAKQNLIHVTNDLAAFGQKHNSQISFSLDLAGINLSAVKNVNSELNIKVTNTGDVYIESEVSAVHVVKSFNESRKASVQLCYGLAQQALYKDEVGSLRVSYINSDKKAFRQSEMTDMLNSLKLSDNPYFREQGITVPNLINSSDIQSHIAWYNQEISDTRVTSSSFEITVPTDKELYDTLLTVNEDYAYRVTAQFWFGLMVRRNDKETVNVIMEAYADQVDVQPYLADVLRAMDGNHQLDSSRIRSVAEKHRRLGRSIQSLINGRWDKYFGMIENAHLAADSMRSIINAIHQIDQVIDDVENMSGDAKSKAEQLSQQLAPINKAIEQNLTRWIKVQGTLKGIFTQDVNKNLLCFYLILAKLTGKHEGFVRSLIAVSGKQDLRKIRVVV